MVSTAFLSTNQGGSHGHKDLLGGDRESQNHLLADFDLIGFQKGLDQMRSWSELRDWVFGEPTFKGLFPQGDYETVSQEDWFRSLESGLQLSKLNDSDGLVLRRILISLVLQRARGLYPIGQAQQPVMWAMDALTGLPVGAALEPIVQKCIDTYRKSGALFSILFIDIDQFKRVNDQFGHLAGNRLLAQMAGLLKGALRESDGVVRYGGDEFVVVLEGASAEQSWETAERLRKKVEASRFHNIVEEAFIQVTVSVGLAVCPEDASTSLQVIETADFAMFGAKRKGANQVFRIPKGWSVS